MDEIIGTLIRLGYTVGLAQDHSDNDEVDYDHVYRVIGYGVDTQVWEEGDLRSIVTGHQERIERQRAEDAERLAQARSSAE